VLVQELCALVPPELPVVVHSRHCAAEMTDWLARRPAGRTVACRADPPPLDAGSAVIVVNAARDHAATAAWALAGGAAVLVEKPLTTSVADARRLVALAGERPGRLASAHVFLFARYVDEFARRVAAAGGVRSLRVVWRDPRVEIRHGETKRFDPGVPALVDWLPHIVPLLTTLQPHPLTGCECRQVARGGAAVELVFAAGPVSCGASLERNAGRRERLIEVETGAGRLTLDFATEPGTITHGSSVENADPAWDRGPRPVRRLLETFLHSAATRTGDPRLDVQHGLRACALAAEAASGYGRQVADWLRDRLVASATPGPDETYALTEMLHGGWRPTDDELAAALSRVSTRLAALPAARRGELLRDTDLAPALRLLSQA
jgi:predicted dehydrogenase